jgi:hypothetical protein
MRLREILIKSDKINDLEFSRKVYANLCNLVWYDYIDDFLITESWRNSGAFVAEIRNKGESYMDFYCGGKEGIVDDEIKEFFNNNGIVLFEDFYEHDKNMDIFEKAEIYKKNHPVVVAYNRDNKIKKILDV